MPVSWVVLRDDFLVTTCLLCSESKGICQLQMETSDSFVSLHISRYMNAPASNMGHLTDWHADSLLNPTSTLHRTLDSLNELPFLAHLRATSLLGRDRANPLGPMPWTPLLPSSVDVNRGQFEHFISGPEVVKEDQFAVGEFDGVAMVRTSESMANATVSLLDSSTRPILHVNAVAYMGNKSLANVSHHAGSVGKGVAQGDDGDNLMPEMEVDAEGHNFIYLLIFWGVP
ncbi:hypothetical protein C8F01DRAFT_1254736 [Mycena amicta]|nr:hypothetical protein C8F01DRAFT_1254736 [Mycena amicta]